MEEIWKDIPNYGGYQVSNLGKVKNLYKKCGKYFQIKKYYPHILNGYIANNGYYIANLQNKRFLVHRLVAETFIPNPNNYPVVNHIDGNKLNNNVNNLEWCSYKHNTQEAIKMGSYKKRDKEMSLNPRRSKTIAQYELNGKYIKTYRNSVVAEKTLKKQNIKISARNIRAAASGKRKSAGGFLWIYT